MAVVLIVIVAGKMTTIGLRSSSVNTNFANNDDIGNNNDNDDNNNENKDDYHNDDSNLNANKCDNTNDRPQFYYVLNCNACNY
eukprot:scaffold495991_cov37-Prasinocladus_malaysianus.AAC.1